MTLTATLVADGTSDRVLLPIINFLMDEYSPRPHRVLFAEGLHAGPLSTRIPHAVNSFPCDLLFVHRDAEATAVADREHEIRQATVALGASAHPIHIIPVRMTETWLLVDVRAIRRAAGNPNGQQAVVVPPLDRLEAQPDPKEILFRALIAAKDLGARRLRGFRPETLRHRVSELIEDYGQLRSLTSFRHFEQQVATYFQGQI